MPLLLLFLVLLLPGCAHLRGGKPPGPWYEAYEPINDPDSVAFLNQCFEKAQAEFGEPVVPVKKILLRRSRKTQEARRYRIGEDFSLTECVDSTNGLFAVYIGVDPGHSNYHALLAHEAVHLLNPYITDWYMEGIATLFSEQTCAGMGCEWGDWKRYFMKSRREPYALSYRMMMELQKAFPEQYPDIMHYTIAHNAKSGPWLQIDIDRWIDSLPSNRRDEARWIIEGYAPELLRHTGKVYGFAEPLPQ